MSGQEKRPVGRPKKYTQELADTICERMINGEHIVKICKDEDMPGRSTVYRWMDDFPEFGTRIARAREGLADFMASKILEMADKSTNDTANADRVKLAAWQWHAARLAPRRYGDKQITEVTGANGGPVKVEAQTIDITNLSSEDLLAFRNIITKVKGDK